MHLSIMQNNFSNHNAASTLVKYSLGIHFLFDSVTNYLCFNEKMGVARWRSVLKMFFFSPNNEKINTWNNYEQHKEHTTKVHEVEEYLRQQIHWCIVLQLHLQFSERTDHETKQNKKEKDKMSVTTWTKKNC